MRADPDLAKHASWVDTFRNKCDRTASKEQIMDILKLEVGDVFQKVLLCAGVYKRDEAGQKAFMRFIDYVNTND